MVKIICITGIDGAGKDTLLGLLTKELDSVIVADIWDKFKDGSESQLFSSKKDIDNYLCNLSPDSRLLFLAHALKYSIDKALNTECDYILLNAYYYKYFASEISLGANLQIVEEIIKLFPKPDLVFHLNIDIEVAASRKQKFSRYECGLTDKAEIRDFINAQKNAKKEWSRFNLDETISLDANKTPEELLAEVLESIKIGI